MIETLVDLIRHGEPVGGKKYRGQTDDPLSETGWEQMRTAVAGHNGWDVIISSPLQRCHAFACELAERNNIPLRVEERFMEIGFGSWEGKTAAELMQHQQEILLNFWRDPVRHRPEGAEPLVDFNKRIISGWQDLLREHGGKHVLVVCHAGTIRMSLQYILDMPLAHVFRINVSHAGITRFRIEQTDDEMYPRLMFHGGDL